MSTCKDIDHWDFKLKITNNSDRIIYFYNSDIYPDTTISFEYNPINSIGYRVNPGVTESNRIRGTWEDKFQYIDTLMIFIFDEETLQIVPWDTIQEKYMILKRYDLSLEDLQGMNWTITYP
jgi:hypothetical protein